MMKRHGRAAADQSYGGVFVYNRPEQVLEQYDLEVRAVSKGRESYICDTTQGQLLLKEYKGSAERAEFLSAMLGHLGGQGLLTEQIVRTKEDAPIAVAEDETKYMVLTAVSGSECDTRNRADMIAGAEKLAMLHNAAGTYSETVPEFVCNDPNELQELYEKHNRELRKIRKFIRKKRPACVFEKKYLESAEDFLKNGEEALEMLKSSNYQELRQKAEETGTVCHGEYNHHNVIFFRQGIAVTNFNRWSCDIQMKDFYGFMRKIQEKHNWDTELAGRMLRTYHRKKGISREEWQYLKIRFAYPDKYWKLADYYYTHNKAWISARNTEKLRKLTEQKSRWERFIWKCFQKYPF